MCKRRSMGSRACAMALAARSRGTRCGEASATSRWPEVRRTRARCSYRRVERHRGESTGARRGVGGDLSRHRDGPPTCTRTRVAKPWLGADGVRDAWHGRPGCYARSRIENVAVRADGAFLELPAGPAYRELKEIRNVITVIAKAAHYWLGHMPVIHRQTIAALMAGMNDESPLIAPLYASDEQQTKAPARRWPTRWPRSFTARPAWPTRLGTTRTGWAWNAPLPQAAFSMLRMLLAVNVLARREGPVLFVPINPDVDHDGSVVSSAVALVCRLSSA